LGEVYFSVVCSFITVQTVNYYLLKKEEKIQKQAQEKQIHNQQS